MFVKQCSRFGQNLGINSFYRSNGKGVHNLCKKYRDALFNNKSSFDKKRVKRYISFEPKRYELIEENIKTLKFASVTHAIEWGLYVLKEKSDLEK